MCTSPDPAGEDQSRTAAARSRIPLLLWAISLIALGALVRIPGLGRSLWLDELTTAWVCGAEQGTLLNRAWLNNLSPLYYLIVNASIELFGYSELGLRLPSLLGGLAVIPATLLFAWHHHRSKSVAVVVALLATLDPVIVRYAFEARPYAMVMLLSLFQVHLFLTLFTKPSFGRAVTCGVVLALLVYLHYTTILIACAEGVFLPFAWALLRREQRVGIAVFLCPFLVAALLCLPLVPHILYLADSKNTLGFKSARSVWSVFGKFGFAWYVLVPMSAGLVLARLSGRSDTAAKQDSAALSPATQFAFTLCWFLIPSGFIWLLAKTQIARIDVDRYVMVAALAPIVGLGSLVMLCRSQAVRAACLALGCAGCVVAVAGATSRFSEPRQPYGDINDWRSAVAYLREAALDDKPIIVWSGLTEGKWLDNGSSPLLKSYLLCPVNSLYRLEGPEFKDRTLPLAFGKNQIIDARQFELLEKNRGAWILVHEQAQRRHELLDVIRSQLDATGLRSAKIEWEQFKGVVLIHIMIMNR